MWHALFSFPRNLPASRSFSRVCIRLAPFLAATAVGLLNPCVALGAILPVAVLGDPAPDGNGKLNGFGRPSINQAGQVGFTSNAFDTAAFADRLGVYLRSFNGGP